MVSSAGSDPNNNLNFWGTVMDENAGRLPGAVVLLAACYADGGERKLGMTFCDDAGEYFITIPQPLDINAVKEFKLRAGVAEVDDKQSSAAIEVKPSSAAKEAVNEQAGSLPSASMAAKQQPMSGETEVIYHLPNLAETLKDNSVRSIAYLRGDNIWVTIFGRPKLGRHKY